jgi:hypothetical protein
MRRFVLVTLLLAGCDMYFNDGDDDPPCAYDTKAGADLAPAQLLRDPNTGECSGFGGGGGCDDRCGPCPAETTQAIPDWGICYGACEANTEAQCFTASGCYAAYRDEPNALAPVFQGCWQVAPSGPISTGTCGGLDAQECSRHDNCTMHYTNGKFVSCAAEQTVPTPACSTLTENACAARSDCERIYKGEDCTCTPDACECNVLTYQQCVAR